jgi:hypothetical protein
VSFDIPEYMADATGMGTLRLLDAIREEGVRCRFYVAPENPEALLTAASALRADASRLAELGRSAQAYAEAAFDLARIADRFEQVLEGAMTYRRRTARKPLAPSRRIAVPARTMRRAVGPEPRSKAEPTAVGSLAAADDCDWRKRTAPYPLTRFDRDFPSCPAFWSAFAVCFEMYGELVPLCVLPLVGPPPPLVDLPPPPLPRHSL